MGTFILENPDERHIHLLQKMIDTGYLHSGLAQPAGEFQHGVEHGDQAQIADVLSVQGLAYGSSS